MPRCDHPREAMAGDRMTCLRDPDHDGIHVYPDDAVLAEERAAARRPACPGAVSGPCVFVLDSADDYVAGRCDNCGRTAPGGLPGRYRRPMRSRYV